MTVPDREALSAVVTQVVVGWPAASTHFETMVAPPISPGFEPGIQPPVRVYVPWLIVMVKLASAVMLPPTTKAKPTTFGIPSPGMGMA